jgi:DNA processing protein
MTILSLDDADVLAHVRDVAVQRRDDAEAGEVFARGAWTGIAEPGDRVAHALIAAVGAEAALDSLIEQHAPDVLAARSGLDAAELADGIARWRPRLGSAAARRAFSQAARFGARLLVPDDDLWPTGLDDLGDFAPVALWVRGTDAALGTHATGIALVGARAATGYGEHVAMEASAGLVDRGYTIVSGAAYGIDGMAHRAALASGGTTVAYLAGGLDRFYPSGHDALLTRIAQEGAVLSEVPCGTAPTKWRFLQRNRLIAASSAATIVLEAGWRSGSLNTAGHAAALGRPLGAVPGPVTSAASAGCHRLIREFDAVCVTTPDEMAELAPIGAPPDSPDVRRASRSPAEVRVIDALSARSYRSVPDVAARCGMSVPEVQSALGSLDLEGAVHQSDGGWRRT